jgi:pentapeptide MXKDX repeat protein
LSEEALKSSNAMSSNAMSSNAMSSNAMTANALTANAMSSNAMSSNALTANALLSSTTGTKAAMFVRYAARCMLSPSQSVTVTYRQTNGVLKTEKYPGTLGLATNWATGGLSDSQRRWLGACLAAHTNLFGISVPISVRGPHPAVQNTGASERSDFWKQEAAFYATYNANASGTPFQFYTCEGHDLGKADHENRECARGECGPLFINIEERCAHSSGQVTCESEVNSGSGGYLKRCHTSAFDASDGPTSGSGPAMTEVLTVFLTDS